VGNSLWGISGYVDVCVWLLSGAMVSLALFLAAFRSRHPEYTRLIGGQIVDQDQQKLSEYARAHHTNRSGARGERSRWQHSSHQAKRRAAVGPMHAAG